MSARVRVAPEIELPENRGRGDVWRQGPDIFGGNHRQRRIGPARRREGNHGTKRRHAHK